MSAEFTVTARGPFSLRESVEFGFGQRHAEPFAGVMRLAFCVDSLAGHAAVELRQDADVGSQQGGGPVRAVVQGDGEATAVRGQVERMLSLDVDGTDFSRVGERDPVVARRQAQAPGLRPPLFHSPYEAAAWSVLSARRPARQMAQVRDAFALAHGRRFEVAGRTLAAWPTPEQLLRVTEFPGLPPEKIARLHAVARAAAAGWLDAGRLRAMGPELAMAEVRRIKGIGPFYASLIVLRAVGFTDVLPREEPMLRGLVAQLYRLDGPCGPEQLDEIAQAWRPFRTWTAVLIRAAADRPSADRPAAQAAPI